MFTGIIRAVGEIAAVTPRGGDLRLTVRAEGLPWTDYEDGESIAVNGVCLTAVAFHEDGFDMDVSTETLNVTALDGLSVGQKVNLEPSLALGDRLGGHLVSGHVDCLGKVVSRTSDARSIRFELELPAEYSRYAARKGSICIDGVSLTINEVSGNRFTVNIIPHTAQNTIINGYEVGTKVNIEVDMLMRYLERLMPDTGATGLDRDTLEKHGYA